MLRSDTFHWLFVHSLSVPIHHVSEEHGGRDLRHKRAQAFSFLLKAHFFPSVRRSRSCGGGNKEPQRLSEGAERNVQEGNKWSHFRLLIQQSGVGRY